VSARAPSARGRGTWSLSPESFQRLLAALHPDPGEAAERYEVLRRKLTKLFQWRGCAHAEDLVDATFDRVARRLEEGAVVAPGDVTAYLHGVAVHVAQEYWRGAVREQPLPDRVLEAPAPAPAAAPDERSLECLDECLATLPPGGRALLERYHAPGGGQIAARKALAREHGLTPLALRLRAFRLRNTLAACVTACEERTGPETKSGPGA
jgi:DNA-directed RNA polymerase specialized sigma24 family protein